MRKNQVEKLRSLMIMGVALAVAQGCATSESGNIATVEIHPSYTLTGNSSNSVECSASFSVGGSFGTQLKLTSGDTVSCSDGTTSVPMTMSQDIIGTVTYKATGLSYGTNKTYSFVFARPQKTGESFTSTVTLPTEVTFTAPSAGATVEKGAQWNLGWTGNSSKNIDIWISYSNSSQSGGFSLNGRTDNGATIVAASEMSVTATGDSSGTIKLTRYKDGTQDSSLAGRGSIQGRQTAERAVVFH